MASLGRCRAPAFGSRRVSKIDLRYNQRGEQATINQDRGSDWRRPSDRRFLRCVSIHPSAGSHLRGHARDGASHSRLPRAARYPSGRITNAHTRSGRHRERRERSPFAGRPAWAHVGRPDVGFEPKLAGGLFISPFDWLGGVEGGYIEGSRARYQDTAGRRPMAEVIPRALDNPMPLRQPVVCVPRCRLHMRRGACPKHPP